MVEEKAFLNIYKGKHKLLNKASADSGTLGGLGTIHTDQHTRIDLGLG